MCKKYLAKLKQQKSVLKEKEQGIENDKIEELNQRISNSRRELSNLNPKTSFLWKK